MNNQYLSEFLEENKPCSYFNDKVSDMRYKYVENCDPQTYHKMLERGWRRFGNIHFVPECKTCNECKTIRINTNNFTFSKSHKRILKKNKDLRVYIQSPTISFEHLELYNKYHQTMQMKKHWPINKITPAEYKSSYVDGASTYGKEILYMLDDKLIGVALCDMVPEAMSSVYCFYDHEFDNRSIGKFSILIQLILAKQRNIPHLFLGYWIKDHLSMGYKEDYAPFEILQNRPKIDEDCIWEWYEK